MSHAKPCSARHLTGHLRLATLVALLFAPAAFAQPSGLPSFELERLELNPNGKGSLVLGTGDLLPQGGYRVSVAGHYQRNPLVFYLDGNRVGALVSDRVSAHLLLAWAPLRWLEVNAQLPLVAWQRGDDLTAERLGRPATTGLGTPVVAARVGLLSQVRDAPLDLALELGAGLPLGSADTLSRDTPLRLSPKVMAGRRFGRWRAGAEAGVLLRSSVLLNEDGNIQDEPGSELRLGVGVASTGPRLRGELNVRGAVPLSRQGGAVEVLAGLRLPVNETTEIYALGGPGVGSTPGTPLFRVLLGVAFGRTDLAADLARLDDDGDGIRNGEDACPYEAGPASRQGCPLKDQDGDGVEDAQDACPTQAGPAERGGCPLKDQDGDEVADDLDNCPTEKGLPSNQGCPAQEPQFVVITKDKIEIQESVFFATNEAIIQERSFTMLDQLARVIQRHPEIKAIVVEGHSDTQGNAEANRKLSLARARSVKTYLEGKGVEGSRLEATGYGPDRPIATNDTPEGRAANRRVEFTIITAPQGAPERKPGS